MSRLCRGGCPDAIADARQSRHPTTSATANPSDRRSTPTCRGTKLDRTTPDHIGAPAMGEKAVCQSTLDHALVLASCGHRHSRDLGLDPSQGITGREEQGLPVIAAKGQIGSGGLPMHNGAQMPAPGIQDP